MVPGSLPSAAWAIASGPTLTSMTSTSNAAATTPGRHTAGPKLANLLFIYELHRRLDVAGASPWRSPRTLVSPEPRCCARHALVRIRLGLRVIGPCRNLSTAVTETLVSGETRADCDRGCFAREAAYAASHEGALHRDHVSSRQRVPPSKPATKECEPPHVAELIAPILDWTEKDDKAGISWSASLRISWEITPPTFERLLAPGAD